MLYKKLTSKISKTDMCLVRIDYVHSRIPCGKVFAHTKIHVNPPSASEFLD